MAKTVLGVMASERKLRADNRELRVLLRQANEAFDECTGSYAQDLVKAEPWRAAKFRRGRKRVS